jgi:hypothetical protein
VLCNGCHSVHRLACFRDDVVFRKYHSGAVDSSFTNARDSFAVILLYQRWIYRVDYTRANEYGQVLEEVPVAELHEGNAGKILPDELATDPTDSKARQNLRERKGKQTKRV